MQEIVHEVPHYLYPCVCRAGFFFFFFCGGGGKITPVGYEFSNKAVFPVYLVAHMKSICENFAHLQGNMSVGRNFLSRNQFRSPVHLHSSPTPQLVSLGLPPDLITWAAAAAVAYCTRQPGP